MVCKTYELSQEVFDAAAKEALKWDDFNWADPYNCLMGKFVINSLGQSLDESAVDQYGALSDIVADAVSDMAREDYQRSLRDSPPVYRLHSLEAATAKTLPMVLAYIRERVAAGDYKFIGMPE